MSEDRITQRTVTVVMAVIALLAFVFSFGNVWSLALRLGIPGSVAPLIAPMVDLSVVGLLVALRYLSLRGVPASELTAATRLMHVSGFFTLALNVAEPIIAGHYGRACVDAVAPLLLLGWGSVGPALLRHFHAVAILAAAPTESPALLIDTAQVPDQPVLSAPAEAVQPAAPAVAPAPLPATDPAPAAPVPPGLLEAAREIAADHTATHGQPITATQLKARLGVGLPLAKAAHAALTA
ncbi:DUF2637 domain-containing protein [Streptomyces sp. NPDC057486]|uniref:DUF2637 domain-containing protein n=1 Tax=Streptomyces sp. NPDC057486 TaxID=3346145 RepID=UPI0036BC53C7